MPPVSLLRLAQRGGKISLITASRRVNRKLPASEIDFGRFNPLSQLLSVNLSAVDNNRNADCFNSFRDQVFDNPRAFLKLLDGFRRVNVAAFELHWHPYETIFRRVSEEKD